MSRTAVGFLKAAFFCSCVMIVYFRTTSLAAASLWPAVGLAALIIGRWEERAVALTIFLAVVGTRLVRPHDLTAPQYGVMVVDMIETVALVAIAVRSRLWWPSWCAGCHVVALSDHAIFMLRPGMIDPWTYVSGLLVWSWLGFVPLAFGTLDAWMARSQRRAAPA